MFFTKIGEFTILINIVKQDEQTIINFLSPIIFLNYLPMPITLNISELKNYSYDLA